MESNASNAQADVGTLELEGFPIDVDYINLRELSIPRISFRIKGGEIVQILDFNFHPYFYLISPSVRAAEVESEVVSDGDRQIKPLSVCVENRSLFGRNVNALKIEVGLAADVPKISGAMRRFGESFENDIPFARRYIVDNKIIPLIMHKVVVKKLDVGYALKSIAQIDGGEQIDLSVLCFDIEVYNPLGVPRVAKDPIIMISYLFKKGQSRKSGVITFKKIDLDFVEYAENEKAMVLRFIKIVEELDPDIVTGYNSGNFDIKYLLERSRRIGIVFDLSIFEGGTKIENHGLVERVKISGRVHVDMYVVVKFISIVGAAESILKINSKTLKNVYEAITGDSKYNVEKLDIYALWDGDKQGLETLATYNLADAQALEKVYDTFMPIMIEMARITYNTLSDVCVSTTGQLVEFMLMHSAHEFNEIIPNKPTAAESKARLSNPIEGAYVKTPKPGIYENLAMFDFRGLYPSIIIAYNIDPSSICIGQSEECYESPDGTKFYKARPSIMPSLLKMMIKERASVKKMYKKDPSNIFLGAKSMALKIVSNSFYGYLGYARSRWYSRPCASSVTAYGRQYIKEVMAKAEQAGMKVIYGDTDSCILLMGDKSKDNALAFMKHYNESLPGSMELELEDFYKRGVFVGKSSGAAGGAKKKYALISDSGRIKIRGFELVRRDWSKIARDTQRQVLEVILKEGDAQKAADIVKEAVMRLREGLVPMSELVINTQLRKGIDGYDLLSPEVAAARKAVSLGLKKREEVENAIIGYVITKHGNSISDKAELEEFAKDYDPDYYINNQIIPSTMKILKELHFDEEYLKGLGTQKKLM